MEKYKNLTGKSPITRYESGTDFIRVEFKDGGRYLYTIASAGAANIAQMKTLAANGRGLSAFINENVRKNYSNKER